MNNQKYSIIQLGALAMLSNFASAAIKTDGLWTGADNEFYDDVKKYGVKNGEPYSDDADVKHRMEAPQTLEESVDSNYLQKDNVKTVVKLIKSKEDWEIIFPLADDVYTYENFLKAVAKFPHFCNETKLKDSDGNDWSKEKTCRRELAAMFAHWTQETGAHDDKEGEKWTQALYHVHEACGDRDCYYRTDKDDDDNNNFMHGDDYWKPTGDKKYYGRGPLQLSWNYNYGQFSTVSTSPSTYDSKQTLLDDPDKLVTNGSLSMMGGIWFYMTPQSPKPSMHDVITGFFEPNDVDEKANIRADFGTTINIINGGQECGSDGSEKKAKSRGDFYNKWLAHFKLDTESGLSCADQTKGFDSYKTETVDGVDVKKYGAAKVDTYWAKSWDKKACHLVSYMTPHSVYARDDYKRCVCLHHGKGADSCG